jgi:ribosome maturation factor RimP
LIENKIEALLDKLFSNEEEDFQHCFLVSIKTGTNNKVEVFVDSDTGVKFSECQNMSRYLESFIDGEGWLGEQYTLDVSSPGIMNPLLLKRQYPKNVGRRMEIVNAEGVKLEGELMEVLEEVIIIEDMVKEKVGKKNVNKLVRTEIPFDQITKATVQISFKKPKKERKEKKAKKEKK